MYKLKHFLFGWDYIQWSNSAEQGIARVFKSQDGIIWYWRNRATKLADKIICHNQVIWLTCKSKKYIS